MLKILQIISASEGVLKWS